MVESVDRGLQREERNDRRSLRTRRMLEEALVALMLEKRYDEVTVQEIIDRANVGRSTFYAHYMDKEDLLQSEVARLVATLVSHMDYASQAGQNAGGNSIIPSLELLRHVRESRTLIEALVRGRAIEPVLKTMQTHFSKHVEARLIRSLSPGLSPVVPPAVVAQHVAGALLTLFQWWLERGMQEPPEQINDYFINLIRPSVYAATGVEI